MKQRIAESVVAAVFVAALAALASAQAAPNDAAAVVSGTVVDAVTRQPLKEVGVRARNFAGRSSAQPGSAATDAEGHFTIDAIMPGRYFFSALYPGYVGQRMTGGGSSGRVLVVAPDQRITDLVIELIPGSVISGHVKNADGQPMANVSLECVKYSSSAGTKQLRNVAAPGFTNSDGEYRITGLPAGHYFLRAIPPAPAFKPNAAPRKASAGSTTPSVKSSASKKDQTFAPVYYPNAPDTSSAAAMTLRAGEDLASVDFALTPVHGVAVFGKVMIEGTPTPADGAAVTLISNNVSTFQREATADAKGNFELRNVPPGDYVLTARLESLQLHERGFWGQQPLHAADNNLHTTLPVGSGVQVSGRIRVDDKTSVDLTSISVSLEADGNPSVTALMPDVSAVPLRPDGTFTLVDVAEGSYTLEFNALPTGSYLKSTGPLDPLDTGVTVAHDQPSPLIEFLLSSNSAQVSGTVMADSNPATNAFVILIPQGNRASQMRFYKRAVTDPSGRFTLRGVVPGDYNAVALVGADRASLMDPDFLQQFEDRGETLHLQEGSTVTLNLEAALADETSP